MEIHGVCHVAPSCLCSGPEQTLNTGCKKGTFFGGQGCDFLAATVGEGEMSGIALFAICNLTA